MPLILVVEPETRFVIRISDVLRPEGFSVEAVGDQDRALQLAASRAPALVLVSSDVPGASLLFDSFSQRRGGPGVVALIPERQASQATTLGSRADSSLVKPFSDQDLLLAVRRCLQTARAGAPPADPAGHKLTSEEIFGDLLAELSSNEGSGAAAPKKARSPDAASPGEIDRKLEETLSGVLGPARKPGPAPARPAQPAAAAVPPAPAPTRRPKTETSGVEELISRTLHDLDLGRGKQRAAPAGPAGPARPSDLSAARPASPPPELQRSAATASPAIDLAAAAPRQSPTPSAPAPPEPPRQEAPPRLPQAATTMPMPAVSPKPPAEPPPAPARPAPPEPPRLSREPAAPAVTVEAPNLLVTQRIPTARAAAEASAQQFGQYSLLQKIAVGGMAEVWKARMKGVEGFQKTVAIKKILPHLTDNSAFVTMFIDEAKLAAQLNHPNITHIYDLGKIGDDYYIAMEYVEGRNLRALLNAARRRAAKVPLGLALLIGARLASALDYAHRKRGFDGRELGLVHRDVSPQNVLISYEGDIKLCDFGIVKAVSKASHTQMGALKGKLQYMSPEQAWGKQVDGRSDLFSLGAILFETLTGRRLFPGDNEISVLEAVRECRVDSLRDLEPGIPPEVDDLVAKALAKDPEERFQNAGAMQQAIEAVLYSLRPAPSQAELAAFMHELSTVTEREIAGGGEEPPSSASGPRPASRLPEPRGAERPAARAEPRVELPPELVQPRTPIGRREPTRSGETSPPSTAAADAVAVAPVRTGRVELEEGGKGGRAGLVAAIAALLVVALGAGWIYRARLFGGAAGEGGDSAVAAQEGEAGPADGAASSETAGEAATTGAAPVAGQAAGTLAETRPQAEGSPGASGPAAPAEVSVTELVNAEMARRELELKKKLEADAKRLEQQLVQAKAAEEQRRLEEEQQRQREADEASRREAEQRATAEAEARQKAEAERLAREQEETRRREEERQKAEVEAKRTKVGQLVELGPGVVSPVLVSVSKPEYPPVARRLRVEGVVEVEVLVDENGAVSDARIVKAARQDVGMNEAALSAARTAKFQPATKDGVRVKVWYRLRIPFQL
jgi:TonB family protein